MNDPQEQIFSSESVLRPLPVKQKTAMLCHKESKKLYERSFFDQSIIFLKSFQKSLNFCLFCEGKEGKK